MPISQELIERTLQTGMKPLELEYIPVYNTEDNGGKMFRTVLKINSIEFGELYPEQYRVVANRTQQCVKLAKWAIKEAYDELLRAAEARQFIDGLIVYSPVKFLINGQLCEYIEQTMKDEDGKTVKGICIEFGQDILMTENEQIIKPLERLRAQGVGIVISEFGDEYCPTLRLARIPADMVIFDRYIGECDDALSQNMIDYVRGLGCKAVTVKKREELKCDAYLGGEKLKGAVVNE